MGRKKGVSVQLIFVVAYWIRSCLYSEMYFYITLQSRSSHVETSGQSGLIYFKDHL